MSNGRKVSTDALETLGTIIGDGEKRDAIHLAVLPMVAGEDLGPGEDILVRNGKAYVVPHEEATGIVDPFLAIGPEEGERFWMVLKPRMVTSLRHVWSHPAFEDEPGSAAVMGDKEAAEAWLRSYASDLDVGFRDLIESAGAWLDYGDYMVRGGILEGVSTSDEFWAQYQKYTGKVVPAEKQGDFFSCSC